MGRIDRPGPFHPTSPRLAWEWLAKARLPCLHSPGGSFRRVFAPLPWPSIHRDCVRPTDGECRVLRLPTWPDVSLWTFLSHDRIYIIRVDRNCPEIEPIRYRYLTATCQSVSLQSKSSRNWTSCTKWHAMVLVDFFYYLYTYIHIYIINLWLWRPHLETISTAYNSYKFPKLNYIPLY